MLIKYMLNVPNDINILYTYTEELGESPFGGKDIIRTENRHSREYSQRVIDDIVSQIPKFIECVYEGCKERISREVYSLITSEGTYEIAFVVDKLEEDNIQLHIEILSADIEGDFEITYDKTLEVLKLLLKERLKNDWKVCTWLVDDQSEMLCAALYHKFFRIENQVRAFANKVLMQHLGYDWLKKPGLEKYIGSVLNMETSFKQIVPQFANINSSLMSMTLETLSEIMFKSTVYDPSITLTSTDMFKLFQHFANRSIDGAKQLVQKKRNIKIKVWNDIFEQYFENSEQFKQQINQFIKSRNHIAHNKLLTYNAYNQINDELLNFETTILKAIKLFEDKNASAELLDTWMYEYEQEQEQEQEWFNPEYEKKYWIDRIFGETGVEIRTINEIYDLFCDTIMTLYSDLEDKYHFNSCFDISEAKMPKENENITICTITNNASGKELEIVVSISIDDDMAASSYMYLEAKHNQEVIYKAECCYYNGEGYEGEEGICIAESDSVYDSSQINEFFEDIISYIETEMNPYLQKLAILEFECGRNGGPEPVADFACAECGNNGVSILEEFMPIGKCCYCGYDNEINICELCGTVYDEFAGDNHICNGCMSRIDE